MLLLAYLEKLSLMQSSNGDADSEQREHNSRNAHDVDEEEQHDDAVDYYHDDAD